MTLEDVSAALARIAARAGAVFVVGVGNEISADDGAGPLVAGMLSEARASMEVIDAGTMPENFVSRIAAERPSHVIFVDAAAMPGEPGEVAVVRRERMDDAIATTHHIPLRRVVERLEGMCGCETLVIGIIPSTVEAGEPVSEPVARAAEAVAGLLLELDAALRARGGPA